MIVFVVAAFVLEILHSIFSAIAGWIAALLNWLLGVAITILDEIRSVMYSTLGDEWCDAPVAGAAVIVSLAIWGPRWLRSTIRAVAGVLALLTAIHYVAVVLAFIIRFIGPYIPYVIGSLAALLAITLVGQLLFDQFKTAMNAGNGRLGVIMGAIAIGTALALLILTGLRPSPTRRAVVASASGAPVGG